MKKIRVLNIISDTNIGGAGRVILNYLQYADKRQFETVVAIPKGSLLRDALEQLGTVYYEVDGMADRSYHKEDVRALKKLIAEVKPDLVHTHGALSGRIAAKRCHIPVIYSRHSAFPVPAKLKYPPGRWVNKILNEYYSDHIIAVSPATRDNLTESGISEKHITVVMNGVAPLEQTTEEARRALKQELQIPETVVVFGILARIEDYKGHLYLIEAVQALKRRGKTGFRVLIAGTGTFESQVKQAITDSGAQELIQFLGFRRDVGALLNILDCQLNVSYGTEATSLALLEGMSLGLPSIVSDYGGNPWLVTHGKNGLVFPSRNSEALADCMEQLMEYPEQRSSMRQYAKEVFEQRFTGEVFAEQTQAVYRSVLKGEAE